jgi:hypothetical protein
VSFNKLGDVQMVQGDLAGARGSFEQCLKIRKKLAASDSTNAGWQRDLFASHARIGSLALQSGDLEAARREFTAGLAIIERLVKLDTTNAVWRNDLLWCKEQIENLEG